MDETVRNGHGKRAARLVAVLAVLVGIIVMHGLSSSHHASAAAAHAAPAAPAAPAHHPAATAAHQSDVASAQQSADARSVPADASCDSDCGAVALLCLAVLAVTAGVAVALVAGQRRRCANDAYDHGTLSSPASTRSALPPPDPVRELCVSRT